MTWAKRMTSRGNQHYKWKRIIIGSFSKHPYNKIRVRQNFSHMSWYPNSKGKDHFFATENVTCSVILNVKRALRATTSEEEVTQRSRVRRKNCRPPFVSHVWGLKELPFAPYVVLSACAPFARTDSSIPSLIRPVSRDSESRNLTPFATLLRASLRQDTLTRETVIHDYHVLVIWLVKLRLSSALLKNVWRVWENPFCQHLMRQLSQAEAPVGTRR